MTAGSLRRKIADPRRACRRCEVGLTIVLAWRCSDQGGAACDAYWSTARPETESVF